MTEKLIPMGRYSEIFKQYLPYHFKNDIIYRSVGLEKHILKRHPECLQYIELIPSIIASPDYIGVNPNENYASFELVKVLSDNIKIGIKLDSKNDYLYVATLHTITDAKLKHSLENNRLKKLTQKT